MNSFSIADELDQAVSNVLAGVETAGVNTDLEMGELVGIALELSDLPEPVFKAQLKAQLTGHPVAELRALDLKSWRRGTSPASTRPAYRTSRRFCRLYSGLLLTDTHSISATWQHHYLCTSPHWHWLWLLEYGLLTTNR